MAESLSFISAICLEHKREQNKQTDTKSCIFEVPYLEAMLWKGNNDGRFRFTSFQIQTVEH